MPDLAALPTSASALPSVRLLVRSAVVRAGYRVILSEMGFTVLPGSGSDITASDINGDIAVEPADWADVLLVDDSLLGSPESLEGAPALVSVGSVQWVALLPQLSAGGYAALSAQASPAELYASILGAALGLAVIPPALLSLLAQDNRMQDDEDENSVQASGPLPAGEVTLTPREREVLALLTEGLSNKRAARELGVGESTVKFHVQALYSKLGVQSRTAAVTRGLQLGLVSI